jgi:hypothetical protein
MATNSEVVSLSLVLCFVHVLNLFPPPESQKSPQKSSSEITRRPYIRPALMIDITPTPKHWDVSSSDTDLDINEEDGYVLSANGEGSASGVFIPCDALSGIRNVRRGRLRVKPEVFYRRRLSANPTSPTLNITCPTVSLSASAQSINISLNISPSSLPLVSVSTIYSPPLLPPPTRTSRSCTTVYISATSRWLLLPRARKRPRCIRSHRLPRQPHHPRLLPRAVSDLCSTSRRAHRLGRARHLLLPHCPPHVSRNSGPLVGCRSAQRFLLGPLSITPALLWFDHHQPSSYHGHRFVDFSLLNVCKSPCTILCTHFSNYVSIFAFLTRESRFKRPFIHQSRFAKVYCVRFHRPSNGMFTFQSF